ncbi:hypothetical protein FP435_04505 [Lactobacillus sp. PV037]|uniref:hypothetical protein n=1 Tax=Lactobacillus sp. PV037 TaxID=2594496 RepID=UPI00223FDF50|nr:hypothetical protein [Lactobacillus sp. PV037]QNQ83755.1 hypothetical protein FP435_04505 [Lactobacillus sp. PV037]
MTKVVTFDAKETILDKEFHVMDSMKNIKIVSSNIQKMLTNIDEMERKKREEGAVAINLLDYSDIVYPLIVDGTAKLLGLNSEDKKKLEDMSFDDIKKFYEKVANDFLDMQLPTNDKFSSLAANNETVEEEETEDPKLSAVD